MPRSNLEIGFLIWLLLLPFTIVSYVIFYYIIAQPGFFANTVNLTIFIAIIIILVLAYFWIHGRIAKYAVRGR